MLYENSTATCTIRIFCDTIQHTEVYTVAICTFFGHRDCPETIRPLLRKTLESLIEHQVDTFYIGNQGRFDAIVRTELENLIQQYPHIRYAIVFAYMPNKKLKIPSTHTLLPEGIESVPPRFAISWRNNWMLHQAQYVICYVTHPGSGAARWYQKAKSSKRTVQNIASIPGPFPQA